MLDIGEGENLEQTITSRSGSLQRPYEMGIRTTKTQLEKRRSKKVPDGKGVESKDQIEVSPGWPDPLEEKRFGLIKSYQ